MTERWLPIARLAGRYEVSDLGNIRCVRTAPRGRTTGEPCTPTPTGRSRGYMRVQAWHNGAKVNLSVHREVLTAFVGPREGMQVRHLDGDRSNNRLSNLAWGTALENAADRERHGHTVRGDRHPMRRARIDSLVGAP